MAEGAPMASKQHELEVLYVKDKDEVEPVLKKHIIDADCKVIGLAYKSKITNKAQRTRKIVMVQFSTEKVSILLHVAMMGDWKPDLEGDFAEIMQNADMKKVGLNVLQIVLLLKNEYRLDCKGIYDLIPMAQRIKTNAAFKGNTKYDFPELNASQQVNKDIWALSNMALGTEDFKTPHEVNAAQWEKPLTEGVISWTSYEPIVAQKVHVFLTNAEDEIDQAKGPTALHVTNLPGDVTREELMKFFKSTSNKVPTIHTAPKNRSTANAAVFYNEESEAKDALTEYKGKDFRGREVLIAESEEELKTVEQDMQRDRAELQIYMSNLPYFTTEPQLRNHFKSLADDIKEAKFYCHQDLGVGSVYFTNRDAATRALHEYQNSRFVYAVNKMDPITKERLVERKYRIVMLDSEFLGVIKKQKKEDRNKGKGDDDYDALDPYYSHQQRLKKKHSIEDEELGPGFGRAPRENESLQPSKTLTVEDGPRKARMRKEPSEKAKMRVVADEDKVTLPPGAAPVEWLSQSLQQEKERQQPPAQPTPPPQPLSAQHSQDAPKPQTAVAPAAQQAQGKPTQSPPQPGLPGINVGLSDTTKLQQELAHQNMMNQMIQRANNMAIVNYVQQQKREEIVRAQMQQKQLGGAQTMQALQTAQAQAAQVQATQAAQAQAQAQVHAQAQAQAHAHAQAQAAAHKREMQRKCHQAVSPAGVPGYISIGGTPIGGFYNGVPAAVGSNPQMYMGGGSSGGQGMQGSSAPSGGMSSAQMATSGAAAAAGAPAAAPSGAAAASGAASSTAAASSAGQNVTNTVHVIGLPYPCEEKELSEHFTQAGKVVSCMIQQSKGGAGKGHATIAFTTPQHANSAVEKLHRSTFKEKVLTVDLYKPRSARTVQQPLTAESFGPSTEKVAFERPKEVKVVLEEPPERKAAREAEEAKKKETTDDA